MTCHFARMGVLASAGAGCPALAPLLSPDPLVPRSPAGLPLNLAALVQPDGGVLPAEWVGAVMAGVRTGVRALSVREASEASPLVHDLLATLAEGPRGPCLLLDPGALRQGRSRCH
jgi:hypothetical protein